MGKLEMLEEGKIQMTDDEVIVRSVAEHIDADTIIDYLNQCHPRKVHFIDVYLNGEHLERFDVYSPGRIQDFYFAWFMCEQYRNLNLQKSNGCIKYISEDKEVFEFKATNQYYMFKAEATEYIENKMLEWAKDKAGICFEKKVIQHIFKCDEPKGTKTIATKVAVSFDEIDKKCRQILKILGKINEPFSWDIPIPIDIDKGQISFEDDSQIHYTTYKVCRA